MAGLIQGRRFDPERAMIAQPLKLVRRISRAGALVYGDRREGDRGIQ
jgi:hypothetical protein